MSENEVSSIETRSKLDLHPLREFARRRFLPSARERDEKHLFPIELLGELHSLGYLNAFVPQALGGIEARTIDLLSISREVAFASPGTTCTMAGHMLALVPLLRYAEPALREEVARAVLSRLSLASFCFTEPEAGSDILRIRTEARRTPGGYLLNGQKCFITNANYAEHFVVVARLQGETDSRKALTLFYIPAGSKGLSTGKPLSKLGQRDSNTSEVYFEDVFVPERHRIGAEGEGLRNARMSLARSRTFFAASAVGLCDRALALAEHFVAERHHYGQPLIAQPNIRSLLARLRTEVQAAWLLSCNSAAEWDAGNFKLSPSSMAKMFAGRVASEVTSQCLELHGGWGYTTEFEVERLYRDAKLYEIIEGPTFVQQAIIAKEVCPEPASAPARPGLKAA
ncbi:MAG: acyl-CoA dehydrogenase family protein [Oligoflexia bacterium]|nr:acyl-CoA dehydrogenase family protein [Oligoflexia bacterium]